MVACFAFIIEICADNTRLQSWVSSSLALYLNNSSFISTSSLPSQYRSDSTPLFVPSTLITSVDDDSTKPHISVLVSVVASVMCILVVMVTGAFAFFVARRRQKRLREAMLYPTPPSGNGRRGCQIADLGMYPGLIDIFGTKISILIGRRYLNY